MPLLLMISTTPSTFRAPIRSSGIKREAARQAAHATPETACVDYRETLHNGAWRGWGGLSQQDRAARVAATNWSTDIDDQDKWTEHFVAAHLALIPASLDPQISYDADDADDGDARE